MKNNYYFLMNLMNIALITLIFSINNLAAQNLVKNSGFEEHQNIPSLWFDNWGYSKTWKNIGFYVQIFDTDYKLNKQEISRGYKMDDYLPYKGKAVAWIPAYLMDTRGSVVGGGESGYLYSLLKKPLEKNKLYSIKFWVNIRGNLIFDKSKDYSFLKHFGISFCNEKPYVTGKYPTPSLLRSDSPFLIPMVDFGKWIQVDYIIKPTANLKYIVIGWFDNPNDPAYRPDTYGPTRYEFLVDDIVVEQLASSDTVNANKAIEWPYVNADGKIVSYQPEVKKNTTINFDFNSSAINQKGETVLDSFILWVKKTSPDEVFQITGYTDSIGTIEYNDVLSLERAQTVKTYLVEKGKLPDYQFIINNNGNNNFISENKTETGRNINRRAKISEAGTQLSQKVYHLVTQHALTGQIDSAFYFLTKWLKIPSTDKILLLFDPDLKNLHTDKRWNGVEYFIRESYKKYRKPELAFKLDSLYCVDQYYRSLGNKFKSAKGSTPLALESGFIENANKAQVLQESAIKTVEKLLLNQDWPSSNEVGQRSSEAPALIIVHSTDTTLMKSYLPIFLKASKNEKLQVVWYARLFDKIMLAEKGIQHFGTQYCSTKENPMEYVLCPIESPDDINEIRANLGLPSLDLNANIRIHEPNNLKEQN